MRTLLALLSVLPVAIICIASGCARSQPPEAGLVAAAGAAPKAPQQPGRTPLTHREEVPNAMSGGSGLTVPRGFAVNVFADGLDNPRRLVIAPGGTPKQYDVFVAESRPSRIRILRESTGDGKSDERFVFTEKTDQPYGLAFHPAGWLYVGNTDAVVRFPYQRGATATNSDPQRITKLTEGGYNQHWTRNVLFSRDFKKLYFTVGSSCNTCEEDDPQRAAISIMNPDGTGRRLFATGLRNPVGMAWRSSTKELWTVVNERDRLGDDVPPDYLTLVRDGGFYGWPYAYTDINGTIVADPDFGDKNPAKVRQATAPTVPVQAHSAALGVAFYPPAPKYVHGINVGPTYFPPEYSGDAFLTFHGSWNRSVKTGYKVVRVNFEKGRPVSVTDFVRGYLRDGQVWGRPVDIAVAPDGSLLFTDDGSDKVWRVAYVGKG